MAMSKFLQSIVRTSAFLRKDVIEVLRQPRLLSTLVAGPFLILLLFGIGYRNQARALRTLFVVPKNSPLRQDIKDYATTLGPQLIYEGVTDDTVSALNRLQKGEVDVVAVTPKDALEQVNNNHRAMFTLYDREIDPFQVEYVRYFGRAYLDEVNRRVLMKVVAQGQSEASTVKDDLEAARKNAQAMRQALEQGDTLAAQQNQLELSQNVDQVSLALDASLGVLSGVEQTVGSNNSNDVKKLKSYLSDIHQTTQTINQFSEPSSSTQADRKKITKIEKDLEDLESQLNEFTSVSPEVLVSPFGSESKSIAPTHPGSVDYFAPAVIALLLQHLAVTFAALSIVRERSTGTIELFRVSPLSAGETLVGKYLSYFIFSSILTFGLTALLHYGLHLPMLGSWLSYALVIAVLIFASFGIGFIISLVSETDSQAVQLTMIVLLASVFFSGFLMSLDFIVQPVRALSWALPTTYGIVMLRNIFLRGLVPDPIKLGGLFAIGLLLMSVSWLILRRMISNE
jgi:ABC-2 type transport system permease protein